MPQELEPVALPVDSDVDESFLISGHTGIYLGSGGDHRLLTLNMDGLNIHIYEAISGTDRYPPGRIMNVMLSRSEFDAIAKIVAGRVARLEERQKKEREEYEAAGKTGDDFDPFLDLP